MRPRPDGPISSSASSVGGSASAAAAAEQLQRAGALIMSEVLPPKRQAAVDRLRRRIDLYAKDHQERHVHYERVVPALCEQQMHDSLVLKQKYLDPKAKQKTTGTGSKSKTSNNSTTSSSSSTTITASATATGGSSASASGSGSNTAERKTAPETHAGNPHSNTQSVSFSIVINSNDFFYCFRQISNAKNYSKNLATNFGIFFKARNSI